ncbi:MAG: hypothetical protein J4O06_15345 [Chloroflexi bacterium]|nr:hypothetical protein [Chloroflexota bacterium]
MELEERIELLEQGLTELKVDIKRLLVDLKELVLRDQNPLGGEASDASPSKPGGIVVIGVPGIGSG